MNIMFTPTAWQQYTEWQKEDKKIVKRINELIKSIDRDGLLNGIGKPEPLKHRKVCSRRITDEHRLTYNFDNNQNLIIYSCKYHYEDQHLPGAFLFIKIKKVAPIATKNTKKYQKNVDNANKTCYYNPGFKGKKLYRSSFPKPKVACFIRFIDIKQHNAFRRCITNVTP